MMTIPVPTVPVAIAHGQPPSPELAAPRVWREGPVVVATKDARWPERCIRCNAPTQGSTKRYRLSWHSPWLYLLLLGCLPLYLLVARLMEVEKIDDHSVSLKCGKAFTQSLPVLDG